MRSRGTPDLDRYAAELVPVPDDGWIACDRTLQANDPRRVIAYLECRGRDVTVTWVRERRQACSYDTIGEALQAMSYTLHSPGAGSAASSAPSRPTEHDRA